MGYFFLVAAWILYFLVHSVMAANQIKDLVASRLPLFTPYYRLIYSIIAIVGLAGLFIFQASLPISFLLEPSRLIRYLSLMLTTAGIIIFSRAFRQYSALGFLGLKQEPVHFVRRGILNKVRHPIYSGTIVLVLGFLLFHPTVATLISVVCILCYLPIGIYLEEKKLIVQFGDEYRKYRNEVPALVPRIFR